MTDTAAAILGRSGVRPRSGHVHRGKNTIQGNLGAGIGHLWTIPQAIFGGSGRAPADQTSNARPNLTPKSG